MWRQESIKILHVFDAAGVACILAKYQRRLGHTTEAIIRDGYDGFGIHAFYGTKIVTPKTPKLKQLGVFGKPLRYSIRTLNVLIFYLYIFFHSRKFDVVHIHCCWMACFFTSKPKVVEFHGDDIRKFPSRKWMIDRAVTWWFINHFKHKIPFLVSTPDLLRDLPEAVYLPNPVDTEHFKRSELMVKGTAVFFNNWHESSLKRAFLLKLKHTLFVLVVDRNEREHFSYSSMPQNLSRFEYFIDREGIHSLSKTALEALAMGLKVIRWDNRIVEGLPCGHLPENVARKSLEIYGEAMKK